HGKPGTGGVPGREQHLRTVTTLRTAQCAAGCAEGVPGDAGRLHPRRPDRPTAEGAPSKNAEGAVALTAPATTGKNCQTCYCRPMRINHRTSLLPAYPAATAGVLVCARPFFNTAFLF